MNPLILILAIVSIQANMVTAIIGEAADQPLIGQIAIACGIKNRPEGLQGVYGVKLSREPSLVERSKATTALSMANPAYCEELIRGADAWENVEAFGNPEGWGTVVFVTKIYDHSFYRRITEGEKQ